MSLNRAAGFGRSESRSFGHKTSVAISNSAAIESSNSLQLAERQRFTDHVLLMRWLRFVRLRPFSGHRSNHIQVSIGHQLGGAFLLVVLTGRYSHPMA